MDGSEQSWQCSPHSSGSVSQKQMFAVPFRQNATERSDTARTAVVPIFLNVRTMPIAESIIVGDRVKVTFANRTYSGVISATGILPETELSKIRDIVEIEEGLERILPEEIELWRKVADYYMCTVGEVYKAAYPVGKINLEEAHAAAVIRARERKKKMLDSMHQKIERIEYRLERKEDLLQKSKEGTKARARYSEEAEKIRICMFMVVRKELPKLKCP